MSPAPDQPAAPRPRDPYPVPHRKNAAEWVMWMALLPFVPMVRAIEFIRARKEARHG